MDILAICTDLDETLLDGEKKLTQQSIRIIKDLNGAVPIILCSARMPSAMRNFQKELNIEGSPLICYNGSLIINYESNGHIEILDSKVIDIDLCEKVVDYVEKTSVHLGLFAEDNWYVPRSDKWAEEEIKNTRVIPMVLPNTEVIKLWRSSNQLGAHKLMCMGDKKEIATIYQQLSTNHSDELRIYRAQPTYLEIAPANVTKATALQHVLKSWYHFNADRVMAFGDNDNDVDLVKSVGLGIAMENAIPEVKQVANEITLKNTENGVAVYIKNYFTR